MRNALDDDALRNVRSLRAVRCFRPDPVAETTVRELIDVARWTGSARNRQPWRVTAITDPDERCALARCGAYATFLEGAPLVLLLAVDRERGGADAEFDAGRFAQSVMLAAHARGLGSCPVSFFPASNIDAATALAGLRQPWVVRTAIAIGHPDPSSACATGRSAIPTGRLAVDAILRARRERGIQGQSPLDSHADTP